MNLNHIILLHWNKYSTWEFCKKNQTIHWSAFNSIKTNFWNGFRFTRIEKIPIGESCFKQTKNKTKQRQNKTKRRKKWTTKKGKLNKLIKFGILKSAWELSRQMLKTATNMTTVAFRIQAISCSFYLFQVDKSGKGHLHKLGIKSAGFSVYRNEIPPLSKKE